MRVNELSKAELVQATAPLARAHAMPAGFYTSEEIFARERAEIFRKHWIFAGRADETPVAGDYRAIDTVGGPVLIIRGEDGELRAFANFCRHRGALLAEGKGNSRTVVCPYHSWVYCVLSVLRRRQRAATNPNPISAAAVGSGTSWGGLCGTIVVCLKFSSPPIQPLQRKRLRTPR